MGGSLIRCDWYSDKKGHLDTDWSDAFIANEC